MSEIGSRLGAGRAKGHLTQLSRGSWCEGTSHGVSWVGQELGSGIRFPQPVRTVLASPVSRRGVAEGLTKDRSPTHAGKTLLFTNRGGFLGRAWWPRAHVAPLPSLLPTVYKVRAVYRCQGPCDMQKRQVCAQHPPSWYSGTHSVPSGLSCCDRLQGHHHGLEMWSGVWQKEPQFLGSDLHLESPFKDSLQPS